MSREERKTKNSSGEERELSKQSIQCELRVSVVSKGTMRNGAVRCGAVRCHEEYRGSERRSTGASSTFAISAIATSLVSWMVRREKRRRQGVSNEKVA
jgi:hypothetical protein